MMNVLSSAFCLYRRMDGGMTSEDYAANEPGRPAPSVRNTPGWPDFRPWSPKTDGVPPAKAQRRLRPSAEASSFQPWRMSASFATADLLMSRFQHLSLRLTAWRRGTELQTDPPLVFLGVLTKLSLKASLWHSVSPDLRSIFTTTAANRFTK